MSIEYNPSLKESLTFQNKSYANRKCNIKNRIGLITPQMTDDFISLHKNIDLEKNSLTTNTNENNTNKNSSKDFVIKTAELCTKKIISDSTQVLVQCKPMMNSTASKTLIKEYSESKRYKEDKLILFPSIKETNKEKEKEKENIKNNKENISQNIPNKSDISNINENNETDSDDIEEIIKYQESHLPVPLSKKDNEKFKILKMKTMKRISMPCNKSVRKFAEDIEPQYEKEFRIQNNFCNLLKRKVVHSTRRIYSSNFVLKKGKQNYNFMVFRDKDIGIYEYWQAHIHENQNDEDFDTDEEQKKLATCFTLGEVKEALTYVRDKSFEDCFMNFNRYSKYRTDEENKYIKEQIEKLQENMKL